jgi:hypothetical protein
MKRDLAQLAVFECGAWMHASIAPRAICDGADALVALERTLKMRSKIRQSALLMQMILGGRELRRGVSELWRHYVIATLSIDDRIVFCFVQAMQAPLIAKCRIGNRESVNGLMCLCTISDF